MISISLSSSSSSSLSDCCALRSNSSSSSSSSSLSDCNAFRPKSSSVILPDEDDQPAAVAFTTSDTNVIPGVVRVQRKGRLVKLHKRIFKDFCMQAARFQPFTRRYVSQFLTIMGAVQEGCTSVIYVALLLMLVMYLYAVTGVILLRENDPYHFQSIEVALVSMLRVAIFDNWGDMFYISFYGCDVYPWIVYTTNPSEASNKLGGVMLCSSPKAQPFLSIIFYISYCFIASLFILSLLIGQIGSAMEERSKRLGKKYALLRLIWQQKDAGQALQKRQRLNRKENEILRLLKLAFNGENVFQQNELKSEEIHKGYFVNKYFQFVWYCGYICDQRSFQNFIITTICGSAVIAGLETSVTPGSYADEILNSINILLQVIFTIECTLKLLAEGTQPLLYFADIWNLIDFFIVFVNYVSKYIGFNIFFFRLIRLFRLMKLLRQFPRLQSIVQSIINSFTSISIVIVLFLSYTALISLLGRSLFKRNDPFRFGTTLESWMLMFQVFTFDNVNTIEYTQMYGCDIFPGGESSGVVGWSTEFCLYPQARFVAASLYFSINIVIGGFLGVTLFIGVVVASMSLSDEELKTREALRKKVFAIAGDHGVSKELLIVYQKIFEFLDITNAGYIGKVELKYAAEVSGAVHVNDVDDFFLLIDKNGSQTIDFGEFLYFMLEFHHVKFKISAEKEQFLRQHRILTNALIKDPVLCEMLPAFYKPTSNQTPKNFPKLDSFMILEAIYEQGEDDDNEREVDVKEAVKVEMSLQSKQVSCNEAKEYINKKNMHRNSVAPQPIVPAATNMNIVHPYPRTTLVAPTDLNVEHAFIFIKPHANNKLVQKYIREYFNDNGVLVKSEGMINTSDLDHRHLIERQYREIGQNAMTKPLLLNLKPISLNLFYKKFGCSWEEAVWKDLVFNCIDACEKFGITVSELKDAWLKATLCIELRSSLHCAYIDSIKGKPAIYVINGFYPAMIAEYLHEGASIYYMSLNWTRDNSGENRVISYPDFNRLIGSPNPVDADVGSIRSGLFTHWQELGLRREPNIIENCIQSSKSSFEAFIGRTLWLSSSMDDDPMGVNLMHHIPRQTVKYWSTNPIYGDISQNKHLSHRLVGLGREECTQEALKLYNAENILHRHQDEGDDGYDGLSKYTQSKRHN